MARQLSLQPFTQPQTSPSPETPKSGGPGLGGLSTRAFSLGWIQSLLGLNPSGVGFLQGPLTARVHRVPGVLCIFWYLPPLPGSHLPLPVRQSGRQAHQG